MPFYGSVLRLLVGFDRYLSDRDGGKLNENVVAYGGELLC